MKTTPTKETPTVDVLYINDNGRTACAKHGGSYLKCAIEADPTAPIHFTPLGSWLRTCDPSPYGCEDCGAVIPGAEAEPPDPRDCCPDQHVAAAVGETYEWSWAGRSTQVTVVAILTADQRCNAVLVQPIGGGESFVTDTCLLNILNK